jgi:hypothetical protein
MSATSFAPASIRPGCVYGYGDGVTYPTAIEALLDGPNHFSP